MFLILYAWRSREFKLRWLAGSPSNGGVTPCSDRVRLLRLAGGGAHGWRGVGLKLGRWLQPRVLRCWTCTRKGAAFARVLFEWKATHQKQAENTPQPAVWDIYFWECLPYRRTRTLS